MELVCGICLLPDKWQGRSELPVGLLEDCRGWAKQSIGLSGRISCVVEAVVWVVGTIVDGGPSSPLGCENKAEPLSGIHEECLGGSIVGP